MNDHVIEEMADAISTELRVPNEDVLRILHQYWQDKIAPIWQVDDLLDTALNMGVPITKENAIEVLKDRNNLTERRIRAIISRQKVKGGR